MFTRITGLLIVPSWLAAMGWLVAHDVWPGISAEEPPQVVVTDWLENEGRQAQYAILDPSGRIGTLWTEYLIDKRSIQREDVAWIYRLPVDVAPLRVTVSSVFTADGRLDEFTLRLANDNTRIELHGERFHSDFSFILEGTSLPTRTFKLPLSAAGMVSGAFNPFSQLTDVEVGRRWRMQVFNPVAAVTGLGGRFIPMLVEVTGAESLVTADGKIDCLVVESANARAWVDRRGTVHRQEITLPVVGTVTVVRETAFDAEARTAARRAPFGT